MTLAAVFPGQGSQSLGMQAELAALLSAYGTAAKTWAEVKDLSEDIARYAESVAAM